MSVYIVRVHSDYWLFDSEEEAKSWIAATKSNPDKFTLELATREMVQAHLDGFKADINRAELTGYRPQPDELARIAELESILETYDSKVSVAEVPKTNFLSDIESKVSELRDLTSEFSLNGTVTPRELAHLINLHEALSDYLHNMTNPV